MNWNHLRQLASSGRVFQAPTPRLTLAQNAYLNLMLCNPSSSGKTVYLADLACEAGEEIWGHLRAGVPTITGTPTAATAAGLLVGMTTTPVGTVSWSTNGTLPWAGNLYEAHRRGAARRLDDTDEVPPTMASALVLAAGNAVVVGYGPAAATLDIAVGVTWWERP